MMCGLLKPTSGTVAVDGVDVGSESGGSQAADWLHVAEVLAVREPDGRAEHSILRRALRPFRRSNLAAERNSSWRWRGLRAVNVREREIWRADGGSGSRSAAPSCISRGSSFSTSRPAASIRSRAGSSGGSSRSMSRDGVTILVTTHYLDEAEHCHRIAIMNAGKLAAIGTSVELKEIFAGARSSRFSPDHPVDVMRALEGMPDVEKTTRVRDCGARRASDTGRSIVDALTRTSARAAG